MRRKIHKYRKTKFTFYAREEVRMKKKILYGVCITFLMLFCTSCSGNIKSEKEMLQDMTEEMKTIFITQDGETMEIELEPQNLEITKEDKNAKDDTIYATIQLNDNTYEFKGNYVLYYHKYEKGGWILDNYILEDGEIKAVDIPSKEISINEMNNYYFDSIELKDSEFTENRQEADFSYNAKYEGENCSYDGIVVQKYTFESDGTKSGTWDYTLNYEDKFNWDIMHDWSLGEFKSYSNSSLINNELNIKIKDFNDKTGEITYDIERFYNTSAVHPFERQKVSGKGKVETEFNKEGEKEDDPVNLPKVVREEKTHNYGTPVLYFKYELEPNENERGTVNFLGNEAWVYGAGDNSGNYYGKITKETQN